MSGNDDFEITCNAGHVHKNGRSADACELRRVERAEIAAERAEDRVHLIAPEFAEHGGSYYVNRRRKASWRGK